jgi:hypothetical protein
MNRIAITLALTIRLAGCAGGNSAHSSTTGTPGPTHSHVELAGADYTRSAAAGVSPGLTIVREHDAIGDWATVLDDRGTELCMFSTDPGERLDAAHLADVCGWARR